MRGQERGEEGDDMRGWDGMGGWERGRRDGCRGRPILMASLGRDAEEPSTG